MRFSSNGMRIIVVNFQSGGGMPLLPALVIPREIAGNGEQVGRKSGGRRVGCAVLAASCSPVMRRRKAATLSLQRNMISFKAASSPAASRCMASISASRGTSGIGRSPRTSGVVVIEKNPLAKHEVRHKDTDEPLLE
jgi:hypothetical protein